MITGTWSGEENIDKKDIPWDSFSSYTPSDNNHISFDTNKSEDVSTGILSTYTFYGDTSTTNLKDRIYSKESFNDVIRRYTHIIDNEISKTMLSIPKKKKHIYRPFQKQ